MIARAPPIYARNLAFSSLTCYKKRVISPDEFRHTLSHFASGVTVISATHDHMMLAVSDRIVTIQQGKVERIRLVSEMHIEVGSIGGH